MPPSEPKNPFYFLLLLSGLLFAVTALAYAIVPTLEQRARDAGQTPPESVFRDALRSDGWKWLLFQLAVLVAFSVASMVLDRLRSLKKEATQSTIAPTERDNPSP